MTSHHRVFTRGICEKQKIGKFDICLNIYNICGKIDA